MFCSRCHTPNFRADRYCRHCGGQLPAAGPVAPVDEEVEEHLRKALALLDQGNANDALVAAQAALALEPGSPFGHSVLAHVYERQGRTAEAIQQLEIVLRVHPQSTADREKLAALKGEGAAVPITRSTTSPRPLVIAIAAACLVTLFGGVYMGMTAKQREEAALREAVGTASPVQQQPLGPATGNPNSVAATPGKTLVGPPAPSGLSRSGLAGASGTNAAAYQPQYPSAPRSSTSSTPLVGRIGLPPVYNQPRGVTGAGAVGLPPAVIGEITPLTPEPQPAFTQETENPASGAPTPPEARGRQPEVAPGEPIETDSGFIRVERTKPRLEAPAAAPRKPGPPPSIRVTFGQGGVESLLEEAQREEGRAEEAAKTGNQSDAVRRYRNAQRLYENIARRGGDEAQAARAGADNCRRALAALSAG